MAGFDGIKWASRQMRYLLSDKQFEILDAEAKVFAVSRSIHYGAFLAFEGIRFFSKKTGDGRVEVILLNWDKNLERFRRGMSFNLGRGQQDLVPTADAGSVFVGWRGDCPYATYCSLRVVDAPMTATAKFDPISLALSTGPEGQRILPIELASITDSLKVQDIPANGKIEGRVAFEAPQSAASLQLIFTGAKDQQAVWSVPEPTLGAQLEIGSLALTPMTFERVASSGSDKPKTGDEYLILTIDVKNLGATDTIHFDPASLLLLPQGQTTGLAPVSLASLKDQITAQDLKPGASLHGVVAFEVPKTDIHLEVTYKNKDNQTARWALTG